MYLLKLNQRIKIIKHIETKLDMLDKFIFRFLKEIKKHDLKENNNKVMLVLGNFINTNNDLQLQI